MVTEFKALAASAAISLMNTKFLDGRTWWIDQIGALLYKAMLQIGPLKVRAVANSVSDYRPLNPLAYLNRCLEEAGYKPNASLYKMIPATDPSDVMRHSSKEEADAAWAKWSSQEPDSSGPEWERQTGKAVYDPEFERNVELARTKWLDDDDDD